MVLATCPAKFYFSSHRQPYKVRGGEREARQGATLLVSTQASAGSRLRLCSTMLPNLPILQMAGRLMLGDTPHLTQNCRRLRPKKAVAASEVKALVTGTASYNRHGVGWRGKLKK